MAVHNCGSLSTNRAGDCRLLDGKSSIFLNYFLINPVSRAGLSWADGSNSQWPQLGSELIRPDYSSRGVRVKLACQPCQHWQSAADQGWSEARSWSGLIQAHGLADWQIPSSSVVSCVIRPARPRGGFPSKTPSRALNLEETWRHSYSKWCHISSRARVGKFCGRSTSLPRGRAVEISEVRSSDCTPWAAP
jgi:hypothetical protein